MLELKEYQKRTVAAFARWLEALEEARVRSAMGIAALEKAGIEVESSMRNFPAMAWRKLADTGGAASASASHIDRADGAGRPIPHVCFKVPTGGGKTLLGAAALQQMRMQTGFVLWIVPSRAIFAQTRKAFWTKQHPYRQLLDLASGGRVKVLEKDDLLDVNHLRSHFCLMLLMLPAANRRKGREFLRMFRDSGRYSTLFPREDDDRALAALLDRNPDLDCHPGGLVKHSLFNVLKMQRPVVVLDEAHKAYGGKGADEFVSAVNRINPRMVVELSATPNRSISNLLVDVSGADLKKEQMIKLPVEVTAAVGEWRDTLGRAHDKLAELTAAAGVLHAERGRYIRPIGVVRVERTGRDQRGAGRVHAEDVREYLIRHLGESASAVRVKSADNDEIAREDLLSPYSQVRWIITKAALMEGWDCPFAYLLVMLDNTSSQTAVTQLMGRVMRQPHARQTRMSELDKSYVFCWKMGVDDAVLQVKNGLEREGLTGLDRDVIGSGSIDSEIRTIERRAQFREKDIFLPKVLHRYRGDWIDLSYQRHILPCIEWGEITPPTEIPKRHTAANIFEQTASVDIGDSERSESTQILLETDPSITFMWMVRQLTDIVPNSWQAARIVKEFLRILSQQKMTDIAIYNDRRYLINLLRNKVIDQIEQQAEQVFIQKLRDGDIRFDLEASEPNFKMMESFTLPVTVDDHTLERAGKHVQKSLFDPVFEGQFDSGLEKNFAFYVDQHEAIKWWHRVAVRRQHEYYLRGWQQDRIWPDFVAMSEDGSGNARLLVVETKGAHLEGNPDTHYKTRVFAALEKSLNSEDGYECGEVSLRNGRTRGRFKIVLREESFAEVLS